MTVSALIRRFAVAYLLSLVSSFLLLAYFRNSSTLTITTAALVASTLYVCQSFCVKNGRALNRREVLQAWVAFLTIDIVLQGLRFISFNASVGENIDRLRQFATGELPFMAVFHGICIFIFIHLAGKIAAKKLLARPAAGTEQKELDP